MIDQICVSWLRKLSCLLLLITCNPTFAEIEVIYPNVNGLQDKSFGYKALELALEHQGVKYKLTVAKQAVTNARIRKLIYEKKVSIADFGTSKNYEEQLKAIYFPIDMGLNGWRLLVTHKQNQHKFSYVKDVADLQYAVLAHEAGWNYTRILRHNQLQIYEASNLRSLFMMAQKKRIDGIPLGLNEAHSLLDKYQLPPNQLVVENKLILKYPFARLFFVHKDNQELYTAVKQGLEKAFADGSFKRLFRQYPGHRYFFNSDKLKQRHIIQLENPFISEAVKNIPKKYFLQ